MGQKKNESYQSLKKLLEYAFKIHSLFDRKVKEITVDVDGFETVRVLHEDDKIIYVTDEPEFIEILKTLKISGVRRSTQSQRMRDGKNKTVA